MAGVKGRSGRKPNAEKYARPIAAAEKQIVDRLPAVVEGMLALAVGHLVEETTPDGTRIVYKKSPDFKAAQYCMDRILGKPTERKELEHTGTLTPIRIIEVAVDDDDDEDTASSIENNKEESM